MMRGGMRLSGSVFSRRQLSCRALKASLKNIKVGFRSTLSNKRAAQDFITGTLIDTSIVSVVRSGEDAGKWG